MPSNDDGFRILVDRLWPRGISKEKAKLDLWLKEIAPSTELRKWFDHDVVKWTEFEKRYYVELNKNAKIVDELREIIAKNAKVTLLFGAKDENHNEATTLKKYLENKI